MLTKMQHRKTTLFATIALTITATLSPLTAQENATLPVEQGQAHELDQLDQLVQSSRNDLREDFFAIFRKYAELNRARSDLKQLNDNLAARRQWLQDYDKRQAQ